jgi:hypothetical protein
MLIKEPPDLAIMIIVGLLLLGFAVGFLFGHWTG